MFKCYLCNSISKSGEPCTILPIKIREVEYKTKKGIVFGWEIVKEGYFCKSCAKNYDSPIIEKKAPKFFHQDKWFKDFIKKPKKSYDRGIIKKLSKQDTRFKSNREQARRGRK
uniref:Uncharacterized protein n=1 Tax=viral metagenome TaxID=1070528 RepID=A0A6H1ZDB7_9ZZZZ